MPIITLPDHSTKTFDGAVSALEVAKSISSRLAKEALAAQVNGVLVDVATVIEQDAKVAIVTAKDALGLEVLRHSSAHLLAHAVKTLFPDVQVTIGPVIESGFYYDFAAPTPFTEADLQRIENKMRQLVKANHGVVRACMAREEAIDLFEKMGEHYKVEIIKDIPEEQELTLYRQGDFIDLCRGPHVPRTGLLKAFKLTKLAGAYWRGQSDNAMLQRIYGTAWPTQEALDTHLAQLEEAARRDHRQLAKKMDLFHMQAEAPGLVFWHPKGWTLVNTLRHYIRQQQQQAGYQEINTPQIVDVSLWERSGHLAKFGDGMFMVSQDEGRGYAIKPMSCPCHVQVYNQGIKSYKALPIRYAEFGVCHRNEPSGTLHGLMRGRGFVQDDGHIFCTEKQIQSEVTAFIEQVIKVYCDLGFTQIIYKLSTRPVQRVGDDAVWDKAEQALAEALDHKGVDWGYLPGEGAFYGPKIECSLKDCLGRVWQCGTIQVDFSMPERLGAVYIDAEGEKQTPVMLHRAVLGSFERFIGILLEQFAGHLPLWLAPVQAVVVNVSDKQKAYAQMVTDALLAAGFRVQSDLRAEKMGYKIREHSIARVPYLLILGDNEVADKKVSVRPWNDTKPQLYTLEALIAHWQQLQDQKK